MHILYSTLQSAYGILPESLRLRIHRNSVLKRLKSTGQRFLLGNHQYMYNATYYACVDGDAMRSRDPMSESIIADLKPRTLIDAGCGTGALMEAIRDRGVETCGLEYSDAGLVRCRQRGLTVRPYNILRDAIPGDLTERDVAISFEVAEHLPESGADRLVDLLCGLSNVVVFSAAEPGQGGNEHLNEQPHAYWIAKFASRGWQFDRSLSEAWRQQWTERQVAWFYTANLMIFRKQPAA